jgi:hypothetical protein
MSKLLGDLEMKRIVMAMGLGPKCRNCNGKGWKMVDTAPLPFQ